MFLRAKTRFKDGKPHRYWSIWVMDRGIPTEETLQHMRQAKPPVY